MTDRATSHIRRSRRGHRLLKLDRNWGYAMCSCGAVGHEEIHGNLRRWHLTHEPKVAR